MSCIHKGKTKCFYCSEVFNKSIQELINDWYLSKELKTQGILERYYALRAYVEKQKSFESSLT